MRMLKKLLLAGALVGVIGSLGFAKVAKADEPEVTVSVSDDGKYATVYVTGEGLTGKIALGIAQDPGKLILVKTEPAETGLVAVCHIRDEVINSMLSKLSDTSEITQIVAAYCEEVPGGYAPKVYSQPKTLDQKLFKVKASVSGGTVKLTNNGKNNYGYIFGYAGDTVTMNISEVSGSYVLPDGRVVEAGQDFTVTVGSSASANDYSNLQKEGSDFENTVSLITPSEANVGNSVKISWATSSIDPTFNTTSGVYVFVNNYPVAQGAKTNAMTGSYTITASQMATAGANRAGLFPIKISGFDSNGFEWEKTTTIILIQPNIVKVTTSDFQDFITVGYTMEFTATIPGGVSSSDVKWEVSEGSDYVETIDPSGSSSSSDWKQTVKVKTRYSDDKPKAGDTADVKLKCKINGVYAKIDSDTDTDTVKKLTVYSKPDNAYNTSDGMTYKVPSKVNTGTESGKDSNLSYTVEKSIDEIKGVRLNVLLDGTILGTTTTAAGKGTSDKIDAATMDSIVTNLGRTGKLTKDCTVTLRAYASNSSGDCNKNVYHDTSVEVRRIVAQRVSTSTSTSGGTAGAYTLPLAILSSDNNLVASGARTTTSTSTSTSTSTTTTESEYYAYAIVGRSVKWPDDFYDKNGKAAPSSLTLKDASGVAVTTVTADTSASKNVYYFAANTPSSATDSEGYDKVPKTGQSNVFVYVMVAVVGASVGAGLYSYNKKSKKNI
ncbi:MAG: hypothetical protein IKP31_01690 [Lachnospiraceae bacterium]|nr:hypothetical protein [Lachnospiraceae bacterium]